MNRLLSHPIDAPFADVRTVGDLLALSGCYGCVALLAVLLVWPMTWSV